MIRPLRPSDATRYALLGGACRSNRAYTLDSLGREPHTPLSIVQVARLGLVLPGERACRWVCKCGGQIAAIAAARPRSGLQTWEIAHLLTALDAEAVCDGLLRKACEGVARVGGERVFIRFQTRDPLVGTARVCGFIPCAHELLYHGRQRPGYNRSFAFLREKTPSDEYGLFQLYNASTPSETRLAAGLTFDQWRSSREQSRGRSREIVYERDGVVRGWLRTVQHAGVGKITVVMHPGDEADVGDLIDYGLARLTGIGMVYCLVPKHQVLMQRLLLQRGYEVLTEYVTLVRSMLAPARRKKTRKAVTIAST